MKERNNDRRLLKMYGERNTSTNYLSKLIELNLKVDELRGVAPDFLMRIDAALGNSELARDIYFSLTYGKTLGWKHTKVKSMAELRRYSLYRKNLCWRRACPSPLVLPVPKNRRPRAHTHSQNKLQSKRWPCHG